MIFERMGMFFFSKTRPLFFFIFLSLPLLVSALYLWQKHLELASLHTSYESTLFKAHKSLHKRADKDRFLARYRESENYFIDHHIESMPLLQNEIEWLQAYEKHPALAETKLAQQRLAFLTKGKNRINFTEEAVRKSSQCEETEEKMKKSVEMNQEDLKKILCLIENVPIGSYLPHEKSPQMVITDFSLKKKTSPFKQEIFEVKLDLLKREFKKP